jgi:RecJ-like exonuclease
VFLKRDGHSDEAIERIFATVERGVKLEDETVDCPECKGGGHAEGSFLERCSRCYGNCKIVRIKAP